MEPKHISCDRSPWPPARYQSFIDQNLEFHNQRGINELRGRRIRACFDGWVVLSNRPDNVLWSLWNPLTSKLIRLPPVIHKERDFHYCCLSSPPDNEGSVFMLLPEKIPTIVFCRLDRNRKRLKWTEISYATQLRNISGVDCFLEGPTCCNGKVYAMTSDVHYTFVIEIDTVVRGTEVVISLRPFVELPGTLSLHTIYPFLKGSCTNLFYINVHAYFKDKTRIDEVQLFKLDMPSMMWEELEDLKDDILFLEFGIDNSYSIFYKYAAESEIGGYVHILGKTDKLTSFYLKDRAISSMPCIARESHVLVWAMLECRLEVVHHESKQNKEDNEIVVRPPKGDETELDSTSESPLLNIPFHILEMIMEHCVGIEYMKFRATCKRCYLAAPSIRWSNKAASRRLETYSLVSPWLMILDNYRGIITFIDPICGDRYCINLPQELAGYKVYYSRNGWLLMYEISGPMAFFNPFTSDIRELPEARYLESVCFSAPPTYANCMVVGFTKRSWNVYIHFVSQEPAWRRYRINFNNNDPYCFHFTTLSGRDLYALCSNKKRIEAFTYAGENGISREIVVDKAPISCCTSSTAYFLSNCDEHLLLVIVGEYGKPVEVFKLNHSTKEWEKLDGLGKHMIYISEASCICLEAKSPEMENKIYFPRLMNNEDMKMVFYSLETCKYHTFEDKNIQESFGDNFWKTKHYHQHAWIEPSWS